MSLTKLRHVCEVARVGSFSKAADALHVTQSAVTKSVADLEAKTGIDIFHRTSRGAVLTGEGKSFVDSAERILADCQELLSVAPPSQQTVRGRIRIGVGPAVGQALLSRSVVELVERHREVVVSVTPSSAEQVLGMMRQGELDVVCGTTEGFAEWQDLKIERLGRMKLWLFTRKGHPLTKRQPLTASDIVQYPFVTSSHLEPLSSALAKLYRDHGAEPAVNIHEIDNYPMAQQVVYATDTVGFVSKFGMSSTDFMGRFSVIELGELSRCFPTWDFCCAYRARWDPKPVVKAFIRIMKRNAKDWATG